MLVSHVPVEARWRAGSERTSKVLLEEGFSLGKERLETYFWCNAHERQETRRESGLSDGSTGITAVVSTSTLASGSISAVTCTMVMAGELRPHKLLEATPPPPRV